MKNTALTELIHYINNKGELHKKTLLNKANSLLEKEKEDLINTFGYGFDTGINYENQVQGEFSNDIDYYNKTFKQ